MWNVRSPGKYEVEGITLDDPQEEYDELVDFMRTKLLSLMAGYKYLISKSKTYPLLSFRDIATWVVQDLGMIDK
jgi:hypothetical protein